MSNEVAIDLTLNGVGSLKSQLKSLKAAIAEASDPDQMDALARKAGEVADRIKDANEQVATFTTGSKFESVSKSFSNIGNDLMSLDFEGANEKATTFAKNLGKLNQADISGAIKNITGTVKTLGGAFVKLGMQILANPIFLLVAVIVAIVAAIVIFLHKIGVLKKILDVLMIPINLLIEGFKFLTDAIGLTSYAAEENAEKIKKANEEIIASSKERTEAMSAAYDFEIAKAKINGKDTTQLEVNKSKSISNEATLRRNRMMMELKAASKVASEDNAEQRKKLRESIKAENITIRQASRDRILILMQEQKAKKEQYKKQREDAQKAADDEAAEAKKAAADAAKAAAERWKEKKDAIKKATEDIKKEIDAANKLVVDSTKTQQQKEVDDVKSKYAALITEAEKYKQDTSALKKAEALEIKAINDAAAEAEELKSKEKIKKAQEDSDKKIAIEDAQWLRLQELNAIATKTETEFEKLKLQQKFDEEEKAAGENAELVKALKLKLESDLTDIDKKAAEDRVKIKEEEEKKKRDAQLKTANDALTIAEDGVKSIQALGDIAFAAKMKNVKKGSKEEEALAKKQFTFNKSMQLAGAVVDAGKAVTASLASAPLAIGVVPNPVGIANLVATAAMSAANIAKIASTQFTSTSAPASPSTSNGGGNASVSSSVPSFTPGNLFGQGNNQNNVGSTDSNNITVTAIVSETEITSTQNKVNKIQKSSEL